MRAAVLTVSDGVVAGTREDLSGDLLAGLLESDGYDVERRTVADDAGEIAAAIVELAESANVVLTTGGTGVAPRDVTPEALAPLITRAIPGFGELFRRFSYDEIGTSTLQSRAEAAFCGDTLVFALPGSNGAVTTAMQKIILEQLDIRHRPCNFAELLPRNRG